MNDGQECKRSAAKHIVVTKMRLSRCLLPLASTVSYCFHPGSAANLSAFVSNTTAGGGKSTGRHMTSGDDAGRSPLDHEYPGTAVERMLNIRARVAQLAKGDDLFQPWEDVRRRILWAGGLKDLTNVRPGEGYTGHAFNDFNHVDLTAMMPVDSQNNGEIRGIARGNFLGKGIRVASLPELGSGGSWSTCALGCNKDPPQDVAHIQFQSRIAFKLVWVPNEHFDTFVLVDDDGRQLAHGKPSDGPAGLPNLRERQRNYQIVAGSKYAKEAEALARKNSVKDEL
ncbi:expressed unknown protein [Seminavis robusta]|uniref:Uncharacterized protein n=1 Tax=Seminavis robusta TaxID=568900 RepID=A0A9N8DZ83_9STRA|nr:expressed unknown protein [Seminavis robusta]|eukprot:Sro407_g136780.1 n/a (283) ;mRNA; f:63832-64680